jgi:hypothetical protein
MEIKTITLLSEEEYEKHRTIIPETSWWWLKTPHHSADVHVRVVDKYGEIFTYHCRYSWNGVRPVVVLELSTSDFAFWCKPETLVGSKIEYGKYKWTVLDANSGTIYALCDELITTLPFDAETNVWKESELKAWLETEGLKLVTA